MKTAKSQVTKEKTPMMKIHSASSRRGFTLIELAIVLAIAGVLFVGLWRLLAGGNQQIKDTTAATQQEQLITAVKAFLASDDGQQFMTVDMSGSQRPLGAQFNLYLPTNPTSQATCMNASIQDLTSKQATVWCNLLPPGFSVSSVNAYGQQFKIGVKRDGTTDAGKYPRTYSFMIVTVGGDTIPDSSGGRISAQIGADGGFVYTNAVCSTQANADKTACGAYGAWNALLGDYNLSTNSGGHVASRTFSSPEDNSEMPWLARPALPGDTNFFFNTMTTDLFMGQSKSSAPASIRMKSQAPGAMDLGGNISMYGGNIELGKGTNAGYAQNGQITSPQDGNDITRPLIKIDVSSSANLAKDNLVLIKSNCSQYSNVTLPNKGSSCPPGLSVDGDMTAVVLDVQQAFANVFFYQSDRGLKNSIKPIKGALDTLMKVEAVNFKFNGSDKNSMGIIAQDVEKIYPDIVAVNGKSGMKSVAYHELIAPMIEAIQELKHENDALREQLTEQKARQDQMEKKLNDKITP